MTVTSAPIGSTGQSLDGFGVDANVLQAFRESVVITGPNSSSEIITPVSTQPINFYGLPVWIQGAPFPTSTFVSNPTTSVTLTGTTFVNVVSTVPSTVTIGIVSTFPLGVTSTFSVNNVSTYPNVSSFVVNQLTTTNVNVLNASTFVTNQVSTYPTVSTFPTGTTQVNIVSTVPHGVTGQVSSFVVNNVSTYPNVSSFVTNQISTYPTVSTFPTGTSQIFGTVSTQIISSIPFFVTQSTSPWVVSGSTAVNFSSFVGPQNTTVPTGGALTGVEVAVGIPTTTAAGNLQAAMSDSAGRQVIALYNPRELIGSQATSMSTAASTTETTIVSASSAVFRDLCMLLITTNGSGQGNWRLRPATGTTTPSYVFNTPAAPGSILNILFQPPLPSQLNSNWTLQASNVSTTGHIVALFNNTQ